MLKHYWALCNFSPGNTNYGSTISWILCGQNTWLEGLMLRTPQNLGNIGTYKSAILPWEKSSLISMLSNLQSTTKLKKNRFLKGYTLIITQRNKIINGHENLTTTLLNYCTFCTSSHLGTCMNLITRLVQSFKKKFKKRERKKESPQTESQ